MAELTYDGAREVVAQQLVHDASAHDEGRFDEIGRRFDAIEHAFPRGPEATLRALSVALTFWDGWIDARNHGWQTTSGIQPADWPALARDVAADLLANRAISNEQVCRYFDGTGRRSLAERATGVAERLRRRGAGE